MKYTSSQVNSMSWLKWTETMAEELNKAGFKARGFNKDLGHWEENYKPYDVLCDPRYFIRGVVNGTDAINHLKDIGLLNNGRCPLCGSQITGTPGRFTNGYDHSLHFQICQHCGTKGQRRLRNPSHTGCILSFFWLPWYIIKFIFIQLF